MESFCLFSPCLPSSCLLKTSPMPTQFSGRTRLHSAYHSSSSSHTNFRSPLTGVPKMKDHRRMYPSCLRKVVYTIAHAQLDSQGFSLPPPRSVSVILLAGGQGKRMGASMPKQYLPLLGQPIALHSFYTFMKMEEVKEIIVVCDPSYRDIFEEAGKTSDVVELKFALPGKERQYSVLNGLKEIFDGALLACVHDSARPLVLLKDIHKVISDAYVHGAAVLGVPVKGTIKEINEVKYIHNLGNGDTLVPDEDRNSRTHVHLGSGYNTEFHSGHDLSRNTAKSDGFVMRTLDRKLLWEMQTPQVIEPSLLRKGFELVEERNLEVTDDVSIVEHLNHPVFITEGSYTNLKVTTPDDMIVAERILHQAEEQSQKKP